MTLGNLYKKMAQLFLAGPFLAIYVKRGRRIGSLTEPKPILTKKYEQNMNE